MASKDSGLDCAQSFSSRFLSKNIKIKVNTNIILPVVFVGVKCSVLLNVLHCLMYSIV